MQAQLDAAEAINKKEAEVTEEVDDALDKYDADKNGRLDEGELKNLLADETAINSSEDGAFDADETAIDSSDGALDDPSAQPVLQPSNLVTVKAIPTITITSIDSVTICLSKSDELSNRNFYTYENIGKANLATGKCPELLVACSELTSIANTICVRPSEKPS